MIFFNPSISKKYLLSFCWIYLLLLTPLITTFFSPVFNLTLEFLVLLFLYFHPTYLIVHNLFFWKSFFFFFPSPYRCTSRFCSWPSSFLPFYTSPLSHIFTNSPVSYHLYADDTQLYISFSSSGLCLQLGSSFFQP